MYLKLNRIENIVGKGESACHQYYSPFPHNVSNVKVFKIQIVW